MQKKKSGGFGLFWAVAIVLCLLLVLFSLIFASCSQGSELPEETPAPEVSDAPEAEAPPVNTGAPEETPTLPENSSPPEETPIPGVVPDPEATPQPQIPEVTGTRLQETEDMGQAYLDKFVFLGDSTTYGLGYYNIVGDNQVWTPASGTLTLDRWNYEAFVYPETGENLMLTEMLPLRQPEYLCITLGVNGVSFMGEDYFKETYTALVKKVQELSPKTTIILNSIYPVTVGYEAKNNGINNLKISAANLWVEDVARATGVYYLDSASALMNDSQVLPDEYTNGDGLHLNETSFGLVVDYLRKHGC